MINENDRKGWGEGECVGLVFVDEGIVKFWKESGKGKEETGSRELLSETLLARPLHLHLRTGRASLSSSLLSSIIHISFATSVGLR